MSSASTRRGMAFPLQRRTFVSLVIVGALCSIVALRSQWSWGGVASTGRHGFPA